MPKTLLLTAAALSLCLPQCTKHKGDTVLKGRVLDITDNEPVAGATVWLYNYTTHEVAAETTTDAAGNYTLPETYIDLKLHTFEVRAGKADFVEPWDYGTYVTGPVKKQMTFDVKIQPKAKMKIQFIKRTPNSAANYNFTPISPYFGGQGTQGDTSIVNTIFDVKGNQNIKIYLEVLTPQGKDNKDTLLYNIKHILNNHTVYY